VDWSGLTYRWPKGRCWELDHCAVPWYGVWLFVGFLVALLFAGTLAFFVIGRLASGAS
jgi:hypothetical protein